MLSPDWETHHTGVPDGSATATVVAVDPAATGLVWVDEQWVPAADPAPYWTGQARVQELTQPAPVVGGVDPEASISHLVVLPRGVEPVRGHTLRVTVSTDPLLNGAVLTVVAVVTGSLRFERDVYCRRDD